MKRKHVIALVLFLIIYLWASLGGETENRTTFSPAPTGVRAAFRALEKMDRPVSWWRKSYSDLSTDTEGRTTLLLIAPTQQVERANALLSWVEKGNRLIVFGESGFHAKSSGPLSELWSALRVHPVELNLSALLKDLSPDDAGSKPPSDRTLFQDLSEKFWKSTGNNRVHKERLVARPEKFGIQVEQATKNVHALMLGSGALEEQKSLFDSEKSKKKKDETFDPLPTNAGLQLIAGTEKSMQIARRAWGQGDVWMFADSAPIENEFLDGEDNFRLLYQLTADADSVLFDEFHQGYVEPAPEQTRSKRDALYVFIGMLSLSLLIVALSRSLRFGPPTLLPNEAVAGSTEFATALGLLCKEYEACDLLQFYRNIWWKRLARVLGRPSDTRSERILEEALNKGLLTQHQIPQVARMMKTFETGDEKSMVEAISALEAIIEEKEATQRELEEKREDGLRNKRAA